MKICSRCKENKPLTEFYRRANRDGVPQAYCKTCNAASRTELTQLNRAKAIALLGGRCSNPNCSTPGGYSRYNGALHFHHPDPSLKDDMFHRLRNRNWEYIQKTLVDQGCVLLCANCHIEEHHLVH
jgi:hypothetical protein